MGGGAEMNPPSQVYDTKYADSKFSWAVETLSNFAFTL